jgi:integrase
MGAASTLSDMALTEVIRRMNEAREKAGLARWTDPNQGGREVVPHGFRSSFRDWVSDQTNFSDSVAEAALAHANGDKVEGAYQHGTMLERRRKLMAARTPNAAAKPVADRAEGAGTKESKAKRLTRRHSDSFGRLR